MSNKWTPRDGVMPAAMNGKPPAATTGTNKDGSGLLSACWNRKKNKRKAGTFRRSTMRSRSCSVNRKEFEGAFCEHTWDFRQLKMFFRDSNLDTKSPQKSQGLKWDFARAQLQLKGRNVLPSPREIGKWELLLRQFWNMLWALLIGASSLSLLQFFLDTNELVNLWITLILFAMIFVMCVTSWLQELRARQVVRGFQRLLPQCSQVIRDGKEWNIAAPDLVVGDLVRIRSGERVPADLRLLHCIQLKLEASSITGESEPVEYQCEEVGERISVFEARNVAFNGSLCVEGEGMGIVIRVGENTVIGQTAKLTTGQVPNESRLEAQIRKYVKFLIILACSVAIIVFIVGGFVHRWTNVVQLLANGFLVCAIGMVPCGLPATVTSILTLIARRLASRNVYVKRLDICEALGQVSIIASDKTGTLTKNEMTVTGLWTGNGMIKGLPKTELITLPTSTPAADSPNPDEVPPTPTTPRSPIATMTLQSPGGAHYPKPIIEMLTCMTVCNTAVWNKKEDEKEEEEIRKSSRKESIKAVLWAQSSIKRKRTESTGSAPNAAAGQIDAMERGENQQQEVKRPNARKATATMKIGNESAIGTPSEVAMLNYANSLVNIHQTRQKYEDVAFEVPFNSKRKWHLKIVRMGILGNEAEYRLFMKGASEVLASMCTKILTRNGEQEFGPGNGLEEFEAAYTELANGGHRVIGFAITKFRAPVDIEFSMEAKNVPMDGLTFLGACAIMDPPRDQTKEAILQCKTAGIKVFMVTGDHQLTACAIARQIGLIEDEKPQLQIGNNDGNGQNKKEGSENGFEIDPSSEWAVVQGQQISRLTAPQWDQLILQKKSVVFARTTPEQKLLIVEQCQRRGQIMAMTGDGVNDAPALKKADIGIAMGSGSEVAKQAADIVLVDDNFSSIVKAVEEGRTMFDNIKKLLAYTMPHSFPEVWPIIINFCFGMPVGITALQILAIDLGTEILPGVSLAKEPAEGDVMARPPRAVKKVLISNALLSYSYLYTGQIQSLGCFLSYCCVFWSHGISIPDLWMSALNSWQRGGDVFYSNGHSFSVEEQLYIGRQATSAWQMGIVFGQFFNIWSARTRRASLFTHGFCSNRSLLGALVVELFLINCYVYMPGLNQFLGGAPIPFQCWVVVACVGLFINFYNEIRKYFIRKYPKNKIVRLFKW